MKKSILLLIFIILNTSAINAKELINSTVDVICTNSLSNIKFEVKINSNILNLSDDAVYETVGGYVDIASNSFYLKTSQKVYYLKGEVVKNFENNTNQFISYIPNNVDKFITPSELYNLKNSKKLKFIQKIELKENTIKTNIINVSFDKNLFNKEYLECENDIKISENNYFKYSIVFSFLIFIVILYSRYR